MWGIISKRRESLSLNEPSINLPLSELYKSKTLKINLIFFILILVSFTFINLIFIKNINYFSTYKSSIQTQILFAEFSNNSLTSHSLLNHNHQNHLEYSKSNEHKLILFGLNLIFLFIVIQTIGSYTFSVQSIKKIEEEFKVQLEKNIEMKRYFNERSRDIRKKFKKKLVDLRGKENHFIDSFKKFMDDQINNSTKDIKHFDELKNLRTNLLMNQVGAWVWDISKDQIIIDKSCFNILKLKENNFVGGYALFLNFFDKLSKRQLKKDIAYAIKFNSSFETKCSLKNENSERGLLLKGNIVFDNNNNAQSIHGILMPIECPTKSNSLQKQFLNQPIALFAILDKDFCFEFLNPAWVERTGYSIHELKESPIFNFIHQREKRLFINNLHLLKQDPDSNVSNMKYQFRLNDGNFIKLNLSISYENNRYYVLANPSHQNKTKEPEEFEFNFKENWDQEYLKS
jgi:PAS domain S-box-containing protein